jgi:hypothetical protein
VARSNHSKTEKRPEKIIPWWRHHLRLDAVVWKQKSLRRHVNEDADANVVALIFNGAAMEKTISLFPFTVARDEEKKEIKLQYQVIWHGETLTLKTRSTEKNLLKTMDPHSLQPPARCRRRREGTSGSGRRGRQGRSSPPRRAEVFEKLVQSKSMAHVVNRARLLFGVHVRMCP